MVKEDDKLEPFTHGWNEVQYFCDICGNKCRHTPNLIKLKMLEHVGARDLCHLCGFMSET